MAIPILSTKFFIPKLRSDYVPRPDLVEQLKGGSLNKVSLISAPAGFGKTTIMSALAQESGRPAAWLSLDDGDNEPAQFLTYLATALQVIEPEAGQFSLTLLQARPPAPLNTILIALLNDIVAIPADFFLFLDDYHVIESAEVHNALAYLIDNLPPQMHLVLSSRSDPPLPLSRLRARGQLVELRLSDLRFSMEEAAVFLSQTIGVNLSKEQIAALEARTEGWIAGLQLAALSMRGREDIQAFIQDFSGSHRFVIDYLADEVLSLQPQFLRQFLQQTAFLDRFSAPLCDYITGRDDSNDLLLQLEEANLFLIPLDDRREWYRYHHLFRDFLRAEIEEDQVATLNKKAAEWFLAEELHVEGVKYAFASGDFDSAEAAVARAAPATFNQGSLRILLGWLNDLPGARVIENGQLAIYKAFTLFLIQSLDEVFPYLEAAERSLAREPSDVLKGRLLSLKAHIALSEEKPEECIRLCEEALTLLSEEDRSFRNLTFNALGQVLEVKGDVASAASVYSQALQAGRQSGDHIGALVVFTNLIFSLNELGRRREALVLCDQLGQEIGAIKVAGFSLTDVIDLSRSLLFYEANELDAAQEQAGRALNILSAVNISHGILLSQYSLARIHLAKGEYDAMLPLIQKGIQLAGQVDREAIHGAWFAALGAEADLHIGNLSKAARWAERAGYSAQDRPNHWLEEPYFTFTRLLLAQNRPAEAQELLANMEESARQGGRWRKTITIHLLQARTFLAQRNEDQAREYVGRAMEIAAPENYRRAFLDAGPSIVQLLPKISGGDPVFSEAILTGAGVIGLPPPPASPLIDPLSAREQEVLGLVSKGLSNRQIAEALFVTVGTVKKHLNNIFSKLDVKNRTQAVAKARELGLLA